MLSVFFAEPVFAQILDFNAQDNPRNISLTWKKMALSEAESVVILKKTSKCSDNIFDGEEIYRGNGSEFKDESVIVGEKYCYSSYVYNLSGSYTDFSTTGIIEKKGIWSFLVYLTEKNYFIFFEFLIIAALVFLVRKKKKKLSLIVC